jgi:hypothetical protein
MSEKFNSEIAVIGIDIGKNSFHIVGSDRRSCSVLRQKLNPRHPLDLARSPLRFQKLPPASFA